MPVSDAVIFGQNDPAFSPHARKPVFVLGIRREIVVMDVDGRAGQAESCSYALLSEGAVEEKDGSFRRLRPRVRT